LEKYDNMRGRYSKFRRGILFIVGLMLAGFGVALSTRPELGTSPVSSLPYVTTLMIPWTLGLATIVINLFFVLGQMAILRRRYRLAQLGQLPTLFAFGFFIDLGMGLSSFYIPEFYPLRLLETVAGCAFLAAGISCQLLADVSIMPGDGFVKTVSEEYGITFGTVKICFDVSIVLLAVAASLVFSRTVAGVREGTLVAAILVGLLIKAFRKPIRHLKPLLIK